LGIGNRCWRDDGVGSRIADALQPCLEFEAIDAGCVPENYLERVVGTNPDTILMIDATDFGGTPGEFRLLETENIAQSGLSTHAGSLHMLAQYLQARTGARIALLAIQPANTSAGEGMSPEVSRSARYLQETLRIIAGASLARDLPL
jgi:hydrogenase 3 maturation protease